MKQPIIDSLCDTIQVKFRVNYLTYIIKQTHEQMVNNPVLLYFDRRTQIMAYISMPNNISNLQMQQWVVCGFGLKTVETFAPKSAPNL